MNRDRLKLEMRRSLRPFLFYIGLLVIGATAFALVFKNLNFVRPWKDYREFRVAFDDVKGVFPGGHQVRIHGVRVGQVTKADLEDGEAVLTMKIEKKWGPVYKDAQLRIRPVTPLQDLYINITDRGTEAAGEAKKSDIISGKNTVTPVDVSRVLNTFDLDTRQQLGVLLDELGQGLEDDGGQKLRETFVELAPFLQVAEDATQVLAERRSNVKRMVHNFGELTEELARRNGQLTELVQAGNSTLGELANNQTPFDRTFAELPPLVRTMATSFADVRTLADELDPALTSLRPVADELEDGLDGLGEFGRDAVPALRALRPTVGRLATMAQVLRPTSDDLASSLGRLARQAPSYDTLTGQTPTCFDSMRDFFANTLSVFKFYDTNGGFPRAETTVDVDSFAGAADGLNSRKLPNCIDEIE